MSGENAQAYFGGTEGSVPDHCNKANTVGIPWQSSG